jgi:hypothetical protein
VRRQEHNITMGVTGVRGKCMDLNGIAQGRQNWWAPVEMEMKFGFNKHRELLD